MREERRPFVGGVVFCRDDDELVSDSHQSGVGSVTAGVSDWFSFVVSFP
jgi:hypothetical protein